MLRRRELLKGAVVFATGQLSGANLLQAGHAGAGHGSPGRPRRSTMRGSKGRPDTWRAFPMRLQRMRFPRP